MFEANTSILSNITLMVFKYFHLASSSFIFLLFCLCSSTYNMNDTIQLTLILPVNQKSLKFRTHPFKSFLHKFLSTRWRSNRYLGFEGTRSRISETEGSHMSRDANWRRKQKKSFQTMARRKKKLSRWRELFCFLLLFLTSSRRVAT